MTVIVHMPSDDTVLHRLREKAAEYHAESIIESIKGMNLSKEQKKELLEAIIAEIKSKETF